MSTRTQLDRPGRLAVAPGDVALARFVGQRLRERRLALNMALETLAARAQLPAEHLALHEEGRLRLPAEALWGLAGALGVPLRHFFLDDRSPSPVAERELQQL